MKLILESLNWKDLFTTVSTGASFYDEFLKPSSLAYKQKVKNLTGKIVMMSPQEYIDICAKMFRLHQNRDSSPYRIRKERESQLDRTYKGQIHSKNFQDVIDGKGEYGDKLWLPYVNLAEGGQEGLHRSIWAERQGVTEIPVLVVDWFNKERRELDLKAKEYYDKAKDIINTYLPWFSKTTKNWNSLEEVQEDLVYDLEDNGAKFSDIVINKESEEYISGTMDIIHITIQDIKFEINIKYNKSEGKYYKEGHSIHVLDFYTVNGIQRKDPYNYLEKKLILDEPKYIKENFNESIERVIIYPADQAKQILTKLYNASRKALRVNLDRDLDNKEPDLNITNDRQYAGRITQKGDNFECIDLSKINYNYNGKTLTYQIVEDILETIAHEFAHIQNMNHSNNHKTLTKKYFDILKRDVKVTIQGQGLSEKLILEERKFDLRIINPQDNQEAAVEVLEALNGFKTVKKCYRDNCGPIALDLLDHLESRGIKAKRIQGEFKVDSLNIIDEMDLTKEQQKEFIKKYDNFSNENLKKFIIEKGLEEEYKYIPHYWIEYKSLIIDPTFKMFSPYVNSSISKENYVVNRRIQERLSLKEDIWKDRVTPWLAQILKPHEIAPFINLYKKLKMQGRIPDSLKDIQEVMKKENGLLDLQTAVNSLASEVSKSKYKRGDSTEAKKVYEDKNWKIYHIPTFAASKALGTHTFWCTASCEKDFWMYANTNTIYYCIKNNIDRDDLFDKQDDIARKIAILNNGKELEYWAADNSRWIGEEGWPIDSEGWSWPMGKRDKSLYAKPNFDFPFIEPTKKEKETFNESVNQNLNSKLWENGKLKEDVREAIDNIVEEFISGLNDENIPIHIEDILLVGSNASFNYNDKSDLDIHIVANLREFENYQDILKLLYNYYKSSFNKSYDIKIKGVDVELYIEDSSQTTASNGLYSVVSNEWIKAPCKQNIPVVDIKEPLRMWERKYSKYLLGKVDPQDLLNALYIMRKMSITKYGEYSKGNLVFKEFRNRGYIEELKKATLTQKSKELTLEKVTTTNSLLDKWDEELYSKYGLDLFGLRGQEFTGTDLEVKEN